MGGSQGEQGPDEGLRLLRSMDIFRGLGTDAAAAVERRARVVRARRGQHLADPHGRECGLQFVKRGHVRLYVLDRSGRETTVAVLGTGHIFGEMGALAATPSHLYADAMDEVLVCVLRRRDLEELLRRQPALGLRLIDALVERIHDLEERMAVLSGGDVRHRLLLLLSRLAAAFGRPQQGWVSIDFVSHHEIASMIGSTRETVTAMLSRLAHEGVVRTGWRRMWVHPEGVAALLEASDTGAGSA